jgi:Family of unknown function (DUF6701)
MSLLRLGLLVVSYVVSFGAWADCSDDLGIAVINEISQKSFNFIEVKVDPSISSAQYSSWELSLCYDIKSGNTSTTNCQTIDLSNADDSGFPWMVVDDDHFDFDAVDFQNGFDLLLLDDTGKAIDYLSANTYTHQGDLESCNGYLYDTTVTSLGGTKFIYRSPDGTGDWQQETSNSPNDPDSPGGDNDGGAGTLDHYAISYDGGISFSDSTGITCEASTVTIIAHDSGDSPTAPGSGTTINLSTSSGDGYWSNPDVGSVVDSGGGNATYTFGVNDTVTLQFNHTTTATVNIDIDGGNEGAGEDPNIQFFDSGFRFIDGSDNRIGLGETNEFHQVSAVESGSFFLQAIRTDTDTGSCTGVFSDGADVALRLGAECSNPSTCAGLQVSVTNNAVINPLATSDDNAGTGAAAYTDVTLRFGTDSKAELTMNYPDAGAISLHAEYDILNDDGSDSGVDILGSSSGIVFKPDDLVITVVESNDSPAVTNPGTTSAGNGFLPSATAFRILVEARNADGDLTPNFGNENNPPGVEGISINLSSLVYPAGGNIGSLSSASSFTVTVTAGEFENTAINWDEVGSFTAYASIADGDYLGAGDVTGTTSGTIGRFYPSLIVLNSSSSDNSCSSGGFSYLSEPGIDVIYELEARNLAGGVVVNYDNLDLTYDTGSVNYAAEDNDDGTDLSARLTSLDAISWDDGVAVFSDLTVSFARDLDAISGDTLIDGPFTQLQVGINVDDLDGANIDNLDMQPDEADDATNCVVATNCSFRQIGTTLNAVFGRLLTRDSHGPETAPLSVPFQTEFWQNNQFFLNTDDSCTTLPRTDIAFDSETIDINVDADVGASTTTGSFANLTATDVVMVNGDAQLVFSAPNAQGSFPLDVDLSSVSAIPWLRFDWNQNGDHDDDGQLPTATVSFGNYRGHDRIIYWQEQFR